MDEIKDDIHAAKRLNDKLDELKTAHDNSGLMLYSSDEYRQAQKLIEQIYAAQPAEANDIDHPKPAATDTGSLEDPQTKWFLQWFKDRSTIADSINQLVAWRTGGGRTCFLGDADSLILKPLFIKEVIDSVQEAFPSVERYTVYGRTKSAARLRTLAELKEFRKAGLNRVHYGIESGSNNVLNMVCKGETNNDHIRGCLKTKEAGLSVSVYVMPGLGGQRYSDEHARETADVITQAAPDFVRLRTLQVFPGTSLAKQMKNGSFKEAAEEQVALEIRKMIAQIDAQTRIISDSATNLLQVNGRLPEDRPAMLNIIDSYLDLPPEQKRLFNLQSRLEAFSGQYGGFSEDIYIRLMPYIRDGTLDIAAIPETAVDDLIFLIRSKLMP